MGQSISPPYEGGARGGWAFHQRIHPLPASPYEREELHSTPERLSIQQG